MVGVSDDCAIGATICIPHAAFDHGKSSHWGVAVNRQAQLHGSRRTGIACADSDVGARLFHGVEDLIKQQILCPVWLTCGIVLFLSMVHNNQPYITLDNVGCCNMCQGMQISNQVACALLGCSCAVVSVWLLPS